MTLPAFVYAQPWHLTCGLVAGAFVGYFCGRVRRWFLKDGEL